MSVVRSHGEQGPFTTAPRDKVRGANVSISHGGAGE